jgi:hypothetical protein
VEPDRLVCEVIDELLESVIIKVIRGGDTNDVTPPALRDPLIFGAIWRNFGTDLALETALIAA